MSLDSLPFEIFRDIASPLSTRDLRALSLVNKKLLPFAQTLLFETVSLTLSAFWFKENDPSKDLDALAKWKRDCFFRTLSSLPSFASSISSLTLQVDPVSFNGSPRVSLTISLLRTATSLRHLHLDGFYSGKGTLPSGVINVVPSNLQSLKIGPLVFDQAGLEKILNRLTSLESLDLFEPVWSDLENSFRTTSFSPTNSYNFEFLERTPTGLPFSTLSSRKPRKVSTVSMVPSSQFKH